MIDSTAKSLKASRRGSARHGTSTASRGATRHGGNLRCTGCVQCPGVRPPVESHVRQGLVQHSCAVLRFDTPCTRSRRPRPASGVGAPLIRAWERRYGVVAPGAHDVRLPALRRRDDQRPGHDARAGRRPAGRRPRPPGRSAPGEVAVDEVAPSRPLRAAASLRRPLDSGGPSRPRSSTGSSIAAESTSPADTEAALDEIFASGSFEADRRRPAPARRPRRSATRGRPGTLSVAAEHAASAAVAPSPRRRLPGRRESRRGRRSSSACRPDARHELGALAFAAALRRRGVGVLYLGPDVTVDGWVDVARADARAGRRHRRSSSPDDREAAARCRRGAPGAGRADRRGRGRRGRAEPVALERGPRPRRTWSRGGGGRRRGRSDAGRTDAAESAAHRSSRRPSRPCGRGDSGRGGPSAARIRSAAAPGRSPLNATTRSHRRRRSAADSRVDGETIERPRPTVEVEPTARRARARACVASQTIVSAPSAGVRSSGRITPVEARQGLGEARRVGPARVHHGERDAGLRRSGAPTPARARSGPASPARTRAHPSNSPTPRLQVVEVEALEVHAAGRHGDDPRARRPAQERQQPRDQGERADDEDGKGRLDPVRSLDPLRVDRPGVVDQRRRDATPSPGPGRPRPAPRRASPCRRRRWGSDPRRGRRPARRAGAASRSADRPTRTTRAPRAASVVGRGPAETGRRPGDEHGPTGHRARGRRRPAEEPPPDRGPDPREAADDGDLEAVVERALRGSTLRPRACRRRPARRGASSRRG